METIAIANSKGGTAKTTTAVSLAGVWSQAGLRVRLIDLDPEAWLSKWIAGDGADDGKGLAEAQKSVRRGQIIGSQTDVGNPNDGRARDGSGNAGRR